MLTELFFRAHPNQPLTAEERNSLEAAVARTVRLGARQVVVREGQPITQSNLLLDGFVIRYKDSDDGRRQILALHIPGDFVDLHSYPLKRLEHSVAALTPIKLAMFDHRMIAEITDRSPNLTRILWRSTLIDAAINRQWLVSIGTRGAVKRLAHLFCEMHRRLEVVDRTNGLSYDLPMTQTDLGEATGLTSVHANRMLRELRERGLVEFRAGRVTITDLDGLRSLADFDPAYLYLD